MKKTTLIALLALLLKPSGFGQGTVLWNESVNGPLSNSSGTPTSLTPLQVGTNSIFGTTEVVPSGSSWLLYPDFFTLQVPNNLSVTGVWISVDNPQTAVWIGHTSFTSQLAFVGNAANGSLLSQWGLGSIGAGTYGMQMESHNFQNNPSATDYRLDFVTQTIPEPGAGSLLLVGAGIVGFLRWKKSIE